MCKGCGFGVCLVCAGVCVCLCLLNDNRHLLHDFHVQDKYERFNVDQKKKSVLDSSSKYKSHVEQR